MKKIANLKLTQLGKSEMIMREMNALKGGTNWDTTCNCGCAAIAVATNRDANAYYGYQESAGFGDLSDYGDGGTICDCYVPYSIAAIRAM
jgi:natural product precursor